MKKIEYNIYRFVKLLVRLFYPKTKIEGTENLPDEPCVIVANHTQMNGPIISELYIPKKHYTWCAGQMTKLKEVPAYAYADFWSGKPKHIRWFYKLASYIIAPLAVLIFGNANIIPIYHDKRIISAFRESAKKLEQGANIVIFPEYSKPYSHIVCDFQEGFVDLARIYYRKTGKTLKLVPMYIASELKSAYIGKAVEFSPDEEIKTERKRICKYLMDEITKMAISLPKHKVVPYNNLPRKAYLFNKES